MTTEAARKALAVAIKRYQDDENRLMRKAEASASRALVRYRKILTRQPRTRYVNGCGVEQSGSSRAS